MKKTVLSIFLSLVCIASEAGIGIQSVVTSGLSSGATNAYAVSAEAGDVIVLTCASNKKGSSVGLTAFEQPGGTGTVGAQSALTSDKGIYPTAWAWYYTVTTSGALNLGITADGSISAITAAYVLRADSGGIELADSAMWNDAVDASNLSSYSLDYVFGNALTDGVLIEAVNGRKDGFFAPGSYTEDKTGGANVRVLTSFDGITGTSVSSVYTLSAGADSHTSSALGMAFSEVSATPQPPGFSSDPVIEVDAFQDLFYAASLSDNASDPNGDAMIFSTTNGPSWLTVASNGNLSGTPLVGDLGTNSWTVFVTDGNSGTNSATLKIKVQPGSPVPQTSQTNIVLIVIDDLGWMDLSIQGSTFYETPRINELALGGMRFTQGYAAHPRCLPSRYGLMTGRFPGASAVPVDPPDLIDEEVTIGEALQAGGYATFFGGKWHISHEDALLAQRQGFDINITGGAAGAPPTYFFPYKKSGEPDPTNELNKNALFLDNTTPVGGMVTDRITGASYRRTYAAGENGEYITDRLTDEALDWMAWNADQPMFLYMSHYGVHTPFEAPSALVSKYTTKLGTMDYGDLPEEINVGVGQQKMRQDHPTYAAMIESVDTNIGRLIDQVEALGISSNTIFIFTSDNGGLSNRGGNNGRTLATSNYPLRTGKGWLYEGGIREAFIVKGPGVTPMVNSNSVVNGTDIYPTILELAGQPLQTNDHRNGVSFKSALTGGAYDRGEPIFWHSPLARPYSTGDFNSSALRDGDFKLIWWYDTPGENGEFHYELYNVKTDPGENHDLSFSMPAKAADLLAQIKAWHNHEHWERSVGVIKRPDGDDVSKPPQAWLDDPTAPISLVPNAGNMDLAWGDYVGFDYNIFSKTNLLELSWTSEESGITTNGTSLPEAGNEGFYKVELMLQPES
jgi:arylsulfatase A-like enzyme